MKRMICFFVLTAGLVIGSLLFVSPRASAITYGFVDSNNMFRNTGAFMIKSLNGGYLRLSQNPATGNGGACFGDSGGPNFLTVNGQQLIVSITITGDSVCRSTNVAYRLDIPSAQGFLAAVNAAFGTSIPVSC